MSGHLSPAQGNSWSSGNKMNITLSIHSAITVRDREESKNIIIHIALDVQMWRGLKVVVYECLSLWMYVRVFLGTTTRQTVRKREIEWDLGSVE